MLTRTVNILTTNELVKLTMLRTTWPRTSMVRSNGNVMVTGANILSGDVIAVFGFCLSSEKYSLEILSFCDFMFAFLHTKSLLKRGLVDHFSEGTWYVGKQT